MIMCLAENPTKRFCRFDTITAWNGQRDGQTD